MSQTVIYPGTFDPMTYGHMDLIKRVSKIFNKVIVAIAVNARKSPAFSLAQRIELASTVLKDMPQVEVCGFEGLLIDFAKQKKADVIVRGLRAVADFEYEFQLAAMNHRLASEIETIFMAPSENYGFLSATMVREIAELGGDVAEFVDPIVKAALYKRYGRA
jgi:pantetheine-phosphate adenylyltransferase